MKSTEKNIHRYRPRRKFRNWKIRLVKEGIFTKGRRRLPVFRDITRPNIERLVMSMINQFL